MPTIVIRNLDELTKRKLQLGALMNRRSMEAEAREILRDYATQIPDHFLEPDPHVPANRGEPLALQNAPPPVPFFKAPPPRDGMITEINRQLETLGMSQFSLPDDLPIG